MNNAIPCKVVDCPMLFNLISEFVVLWSSSHKLNVKCTPSHRTKCIQMQLSTAIIRIGRNHSILSRLTKVLFLNDIQALLTFFFFSLSCPDFLAFLPAPVNPHLSKYIIFTWKIILYYIVKKNGLHINIQRVGKNCSDLV